jgi:hypothetical protein
MKCYEDQFLALLGQRSLGEELGEGALHHVLHLEVLHTQQVQNPMFVVRRVS